MTVVFKAELSVMRTVALASIVAISILFEVTFVSVKICVSLDKRADYVS